MSRGLGIIVLMTVAALLLGLRLHGFSLPQWHRVIDGSAESEVVFGASRAIRSDDWAVELPTVLSQRVHQPPFPTANALVGLGMATAASPIRVPALDLLTVFRPSLWGYFVEDDFGLAWQWWLLSAGVFFAYYRLLHLFAGGDRLLAAGGALTLWGAPVFQYWSFHIAEVFVFGASSVVALAYLVTARAWPAVIGRALLAGWCGGCFAMTVYPAWQVPTAYTAIAIVVSLLWSGQVGLRRDRCLGRRLVGLGIAGAVFAGALLLYVIQGHEVIKLVSETVYPGGRFSTGGTMEWWQMFHHTFLPFTRLEDWGDYGNICEAAAMIFVLPLVVAAHVVLMVKHRTIDKKMLPLLVLTAAFYLYAVVGMPRWAAGISLMSYVLPVRLYNTFGLLQALLFIGLVQRLAGDRLAWRWTAALLVAWTGFLIAAALRVQEALPTLRTDRWVVAAVCWVALGFAVLRLPRLRRFAPLALGLVGVSATLWFNPLVRGGAAFLRENPVSQRILLQAGEREACSRWLVFGDAVTFSNLLRVLGLHTPGGTHPYPQFALWQQLNPSGSRRHIYNRYAHVNFFARPGRVVRIGKMSNDQVAVEIDPEHPLLATLGINDVLTSTAVEFAALRASPSFAFVESVGEVSVFRRIDAVPCQTVTAE